MACKGQHKLERWAANLLWRALINTIKWHYALITEINIIVYLQFCVEKTKRLRFPGCIFC